MKHNIISKILGIALLFLLISAAFSLVALAISPLDDESLQPSVISLKGEQAYITAENRTIDLPPMELPDKGPPKLDSQLHQLILAENRGEASSFARQRNIQLVENKVRVVIECAPGSLDAATEAAVALGATVETSYHDLLQVVIPISKVTTLADVPSIRFVRLPWRMLPADITSQGVGLINATQWQTAGFTGAGVKVAILDPGFEGYTTRQNEGELPPLLTTHSFRADGDITGGGEPHGTACAEIIYDIAPDAQFYLVNFDTDVELGNAVQYLIDEGVDIISASFGYPIGGPGDGTGPIYEMVDSARAAGILWVSSIGNYAQCHWQGDFVNTDPDVWHEFYLGDETNHISVSSGDIIIVLLKWDDPWGASGNDYDLLLFDQNLDLVYGSADTQDGDDYPVEWLDYTATYSGYYHIVIAKYGSPAVRNFHLYSVSYHLLEYQVASSSFAIPADSENALTVGAVPWDNPTSLESFSSQGPTKDNRKKPDLVAPDGVTSVTYSPFYGTSASTPHVAGAAALVKEAYSYTPAQIQSFLEGRAIELGSSGKDNLYGSGRLRLGNVPTYTLTMHVSPSGSGTTVPSVGSHTYDAGTMVSLSATPNTGWGFSHWSSDASGTSASTNITMNSNKDVTANFVVRQYTLTMNVSPSGGGTITPTEGSHTYGAGTVVNLSASPNSGYRFSHWSGNVTGTSPSANITMNSDKDITANFVRQYTLTMHVNPPGSGTTVPSVGSHTYDAGTVVNLSATPNSGYRFSHWSGNVTGTSASTNITMNSHKDITANFAEQDFTFEPLPEPACRSIRPGESANYTVYLKSLYEFSSSVNLTAEVSPPPTNGSITASFDAEQIIPEEPSASSLLTVFTTANTTPATYTINITAEGGGKTHATPVNLEVIDTSPRIAEVTLRAGWNMFCLPLEPDPATWADQFSELSPLPTFWGYGYYVGQTYYAGYKANPTPALGDGYWVYLSENASVNVEGLPAQCTVDYCDFAYYLNLVPGWNLIGQPFDGTTSWTNVTMVYNGTPMSLTAAHGTILQNAIYWWTGAGYNFGTAAPLERCKGYWVLTYEECQLVIPPPGD